MGIFGSRAQMTLGFMGERRDDQKPDREAGEGDRSGEKRNRNFKGIAPTCFCAGGERPESPF